MREKMNKNRRRLFKTIGVAVVLGLLPKAARACPKNGPLKEILEGWKGTMNILYSQKGWDEAGLSETPTRAEVRKALKPFLEKIMMGLRDMSEGDKK